MGQYFLQTSNLDRETNTVLYTRETEVVERRAEFAGQGVALAELGGKLEGGEVVRVRTEWRAQPTSTGFLLGTCELAVSRPGDAEPLLTESLSAAEVFMLETQATIDALCLYHNVFRAGEHASSVLFYEGAEPPAPLVCNYTLPEYDPSVTATEATLTHRAATVIGDLVGQSKDGEQRGFAVGVLGRHAIPVVTDVIVPPAEGEGQEASVDFSPESWAFAQGAVRQLGPPFRLLGPLHTHPAGSLRPSPEDWDLFQWGGDASSLFVLAAYVKKRPTAVGYRWVGGTLVCVSLEVEAAAEPEPVAQEAVE